MRSGTPKEIVERISRDFAATIKTAEYQERYLNPVVFEPVGSSPSEFTDFLKEDRRIRREAAEIANIKPTY